MQINSATQSKINWTAGATFIVALATALGLPTEYKEVAFQLLATVPPIVIMIFRTWFTGTKEE